MIEELSSDYSNYLRVNLSGELHEVQDTIDDMLTRLDEFENIVNMVKTDSELCTINFIPLVLQSKQKLDSLCSQVDSLEKFISRVKSDMDTIEMQVEQAEEEIGQTSGRLKNMFKPLFSKKSPTDVQVRRQNRPATYEPPTLFTTSSFFPSKTEGAVQEDQKF